MTHPFLIRELRARFPEVQVPGFEADIFTLPDRALVMCRAVRRSKPACDIEAYGRGWFYLEALVPPGQVSFRHAGRVLSAGERVRLLVNHFAILEWVLAAGSFDLAAFCSRQALPEDIARRFPAPASIFVSDAPHFPLTRRDCHHLLRNARHIVAVDRRETGSPRARRIREAVARHFDEPLRIGRLLQSLGIPPAAGSREFKACYGIPIVNYLNQVRVTNSIWTLVRSRRTATDIGYHLGFSDYKQYHGHMKRFLKATPSGFRGPRRAEDGFK